jgi:bifunctional non-homologous end joining protein LigD
VRSFGSLAAGVSTNREGKCSKDALFHRTDEGTPGREACPRAIGSTLVYYVFDLLFLEGKDLRKEPLTARRKLLADLLKKPPENIRLSGGFRGSKDELLRVAEEFGLEGLVAKRPGSVYESGRRSGAWVKFKTTKS